MKQYTGIVVSNKMDKTIVVEVTRRWQHPLYHKTVKRTKKFMVHDEKNVAKVGEIIKFVECRPISKSKHYSLIENKKS